eukprot:TRINITY_DN15946_c0_g1_i3.p1 TRINITY_DN15946_c0_g1~~TRINITY_DN15946_c0_g1_i3.p1  ORF type:complete len:162 (-),score=17.54 TRINITY_DN15946_c0_g1_i3:67-552(-)
MCIRDRVSTQSTGDACRCEMALPVCCVIPGRPARGDWAQVETTKFQMDLPLAEQVSELCIFLTGEMAPNMGLAIYWSLSPDHDQFSLLGAITVHRPSDVFRVTWSKQSLPEGTVARLGVSVEPLETIALLEPPVSHADNSREFTQGPVSYTHLTLPTKRIV